MDLFALCVGSMIIRMLRLEVRAVNYTCCAPIVQRRGIPGGRGADPWNSGGAAKRCGGQGAASHGQRVRDARGVAAQGEWHPHLSAVPGPEPRARGDAQEEVWRSFYGDLPSSSPMVQPDGTPCRDITAFALDQIPRITKAQQFDILSSMANVAGYVCWRVLHS